jgi:hypothetical protein
MIDSLHVPRPGPSWKNITMTRSWPMSFFFVCFESCDFYLAVVSFTSPIRSRPAERTL